MQRQPLFILCLSFIVGIFTQDFVAFRSGIIYIFLLLSFVSLCTFVIHGFYIHRVRHVSLVFLFFTLGLFAHFLRSKPPILPQLSASENIVFEIKRKLNSNEKNRRYEISAWRGKDFFQSILTVPKSTNDFDFKHLYQAKVYMHKIEKPYHDFQFDYGKYLARKDIYFQSFLPGDYRTAAKSSMTLAEKIRQKRAELLVKIDKTNLRKQTREFTKGIILADRTEMDKATVQDFSRSGLVHILAISGSHVAIIFWIILLLLNPIFPAKLRNYKIIIALLLIWSFAVFIDYGNSVVRSCIMISVYYINILLQRKPDLLHAMALSAFIILLADSAQLFDVGFQLSYLAVLGIFWFNKPILKYLPQAKNNFQNFMVNIVSISVAAQLSTLPLVLFYFHQYSFISIVANLVIIPFSELLIMFALLMTIFIELSLNVPMMNRFYDFFVPKTLMVIHFFADLDFAFFDLIPMSFVEVVVAFVVLFFLRFALIHWNVKNLSRVLYFVLVFCALRILLNYRADSVHEILEHFYFKNRLISVKTGDEVQFIFKADLPREKVEKYVIEPYLISRRTRNYKEIILPESASEIKIGDQIYKIE